MESEQLLILAMTRRTYGLKIDAVRGVDGPLPIRTVPGAPCGVVGLVEQRGRIRTLVDLELLLDDEQSDEPVVTVHLAPPYGHLSLQLRGRLELVQASLSPARMSETCRWEESIAIMDPGGETIHILSPGRIFAEVIERSARA